MNRDFQITATSFAITVTPEEFENMYRKERELGVNIGQILEKINGVFNVDYNGHFGSHIYLSIEKEHHNDKTLHAISEIINREGK